MGKPFQSEISILSSTYLWAMECDIKKLVAVINRTNLHSLVAIGSGGSFTVASFHAWLHEQVTGKACNAITPYQTAHKLRTFRNSTVSIFSAEGKNKDILGTLNLAMDAEPADMFVFTLKSDCPLINEANASNWVSSVAFDMPWLKDGYLATNSLFATCILLYRAYQQLFANKFAALPATLEELIKASIPEFDAELKKYAQAVKNPNEALMVIFGEGGRIASVDIESKMAESALAHILIADFRNFAHGRHLWAERNKTQTATLLIWSEEDKALYENYVSTIPASIPRISMQLHGPREIQILASLWGVLKLVESLGVLRGVDPGDPSVPQYGRDLYSIDAFPSKSDRLAIATAEKAILRKYGFNKSTPVVYLKHSKSYEEFKNQLATAEFSYLVMDYDATLCSPDTRYEGMTESVVRPLIALLEQGITIGIATGRGSSVTKDFLKVIPKPLWGNVWMGLYNGGVIFQLTGEYKPHEQITNTDLTQLYYELNQHQTITAMFDMDPRPTQLTITAIDTTACETAWRVINEVLSEPKFSDLKAVRSTHSWDIISKSVSKVNLVTHFERDGGSSLCIGDRGLWPGNDFELLNIRYSLGVDEISPLNDNCWNIAPNATKSVGATIFYLNRLVVAEGKFKFRVADDE